MWTDTAPAMNEVCAVPFLASFRWYAAWLKARTAGLDDRDACLAATGALGLTSTDMATVTYHTAGEQLSRSFRVPIAGGGRAAKRLQPFEMKISLHDHWQRKLPQTLVTAYGPRPWFRFIFPDIGATIERMPQEGMPLMELNTVLHRLVRRILFRGEEETMTGLLRKDRERLRLLAIERREGYSPDSTILEALSQLGPETLFPLAFPE